MFGDLHLPLVKVRVEPAADEKFALVTSVANPSINTILAC